MIFNIINFLIAVLAVIIGIVALVYAFQKELPDNLKIKKTKENTIEFSVNDKNTLTLTDTRLIVPNLNIKNQNYSWTLVTNEEGKFLFKNENSSDPYHVIFTNNDVDFYNLTSVRKLL